MMRINYKINTPVNIGTADAPIWEDKLFAKSIPYSEANEETAKREAYNGEYTIEDDGQAEPVPASDPVTWDELDSAYQSGYDEGYTEGVNTAYDQ